MRSRSQALLSAGAVMFAIGIAGAGRAPAQSAPDAPALYRTQCAGCHGAALQGGGAPALKSAAIAQQDSDELFAAIKDRMPLSKPGSLSDAEAQALTAFVVAQNKTK